VTAARTHALARRVRRHPLRTLGALAVCAGIVATAAPAGAEWPLLTRVTRLVDGGSQAVVPAPDEPCDGPVARDGGGTWVCTFSDEFAGSTLDRTRWVPQQTAASGFTTGVECFVDDPDNVKVTGGALQLTARKERSSVPCGYARNPSFRTRYTTGSVSTFDRWSQERGRFEIRARFPAAMVRGLQEALWLWPDDPVRYGRWPLSGEIDIAEVYSVNNDRAIPYIHYANADPYDLTVTNNYCLLDPADYHTYVAEWTATSIRILYDGQVCIDHEIDPYEPLEAPAPFDQPFIIALTQGFGVGSNAFSSSVTRLPATTYVDYVRVWE
jgi:beta-glucanase (GH16 family)